MLILSRKHGTTINSMYCLAMDFLFAFFAYDSAKMQLKKTKLS